MITRLKQHSLWLLVALLVVAVICRVAYWQVEHHEENPSIVTVNITALTHEFVLHLAKTSPNKNNQPAIARFAQQLQQALLQLSQQEHVVVMPSQAVIAGAPDKTNMIRQALGLPLKEERS